MKAYEGCQNSPGGVRTVLRFTVQGLGPGDHGLHIWIRLLQSVVLVEQCTLHLGGLRCKALNPKTSLNSIINPLK